MSRPADEAPEAPGSDGDDGPLTDPVVEVGAVRLDNSGPLAIIGGVNVLESLDLALRVGERFVELTSALGLPYLFKASFDKANRSSVDSFRGPGLDRGLEMLATIRARLGVEVVTDVHTAEQAAPVAEVAGLVQIPAFLCRQTDLIAACARTGRPLHIKKMQMMAPADLRHALAKCAAFGNRKVVLCERGTSFGYGRLIVDPLSFPQMKALGAPVSFDVTHALQLPGGAGGGHASTGGRRAFAEPLAIAGVSQGIAALFIEAHPEPDVALCDGPSATRLDALPDLLRRVARLDACVKSTWHSDVTSM